MAENVRYVSLLPRGAKAIVDAMSSRDRRVVLVAFPNIQSLDLAGPLEVFDGAQRVLRATRPNEPGYRVEVVAESTAPFASSSGLTITPHRSLSQVRGPIDTLLIVGGNGAREAVQRPALLDWVRRAAKRSRRVTSVCSGSFVLAAAGLLDGHRATTHWSRCDLLARLFPKVTVDADAIYVRDGKLWTSAGVTAGMDLALALVEDDVGRDVALNVARHLVLFVRRPGGQSQFSAQLSSQIAERAPLRELQGWISDHVSEDLSVTALAQRVGMSPRNFARAFVTEVGTTPAVYVERARIEVARRLLETTRMDLTAIASGAGFGTVETLRRTFARQLGVAPKDYRRRFQPPQEHAHEHRDSAVRSDHSARRHRSVRGAQSLTRRQSELRRSQ